MNISKNELKTGITRRYIVALSIMALLSTAAFYILKETIKSSQSTGFIVNKSGKQRMLSQHIALDVYRICHQEFESERELEEQKSVLNKHAKEMLAINKMLSTGILSNGNKVSLSAKIHAMYFGEMQVASRVQMYVHSASAIVNKDTPQEISESKKYIDKHSESLLIDLNKVVSQYQLEGEEKLEDMQQVELFLWIFTIFTLLLEVIIIFQPMVRYLLELSFENEKVLKDLETKVQLRTLYLEDANTKLSHLASHDPLTGLQNRLKLENSIERAIELHQTHNVSYAVIMLDIDWFKNVNDTYGHDVGDTVLIEIANIIKNALREDDKVFRAGGEEFVVLLHSITEKESIKLAEKIRVLVQKHLFRVDDKTFSKTVSSGLYHSSLVNAQSVRDVLKLIDIALYESKASGRNRITITREDMNAGVVEKVVSKLTLKFSNKSLEELLEYKDESFLIDFAVKEIFNKEKTFLSAIHKSDLYLLEQLPQTITKETPFSTTLRIIDTQEHIYICRASIYEDEARNVVLSLVNATKLAEHVSDATLIKNLQAMLENTNDYIYFKDANHVFTAASKSLVDITSVENRDQFIGTVDYDVFPRDLADEYFKLERDVFDNKHAVAQELQATLDNDGNKAWVDNRKYPIYDEKGTVVGLFGIARVVSDNEHINVLIKKEKQ